MNVYEKQQARKAAEVRYVQTWDAEALRKQNPTTAKPGEVTVQVKK